MQDFSKTIEHDWLQTFTYQYIWVEGTYHRFYEKFKINKTSVQSKSFFSPKEATFHIKQKY